MTVRLSEETKQKFGGRTLKRGDRVLARMCLSFMDTEGNSLPDQIGNCEAVVSRIENDIPMFVAVNPYDNKTLEIRQMSMPFVPSVDDLFLWSWTWLWVPLCELRAGAVFVTQSGIKAVKTKYWTNDLIDCYLLASGEYARFSSSCAEHNSVLVREIKVSN